MCKITLLLQIEAKKHYNSKGYQFFSGVLFFLPKLCGSNITKNLLAQDASWFVPRDSLVGVGMETRVSDYGMCWVCSVLGMSCCSKRIVD